MRNKNDLAALNRYFFPALLVLFGITFFLRGNYKSVDEIHPAVLKEPLQTGPTEKTPFHFEKNDYAYTVTPLYDYDIRGLVVHKLNYNTWYSPYKTDRTFIADLCLIWGENAKSKVYKNPAIRFSQDQRFCWCQMADKVDFDFFKLSNNHLVVKDDKIAAKIRRIFPGDQIRIKGRLVDIHARITGRPDAYDYKEIQWHSSTTRTDTDQGACEVIYVKDIEILAAGNPAARALNTFSFYGLILLVLLNLLQMSRPPENQ